jgi:alpha-glucosidase
VNDYQRVDSELGGNLNLIELSKNLENAGFRYILDGVFNHTGSNCKWFNNSGEGEKGAIQSLTSKYHNYYIFEKFPEKYACFWGEKHLPKLNWNSLELRKEIFLDEDSVTKKWLSEPFNASGWRIDASCMIGKYKETQINDVILGALYSSVKSINNDCIIIGENPFDPIEIKQYQHLDGITNYSGFYTPLELWLKDDVDFTVEHFKDALLEFRSLLGFQFTLTSKNFLSNHDKPRFFSLIGKNKSIYELSLIFLFTYPGIPTLYFGDEIGLYADELSDDSRICMKWENYDAGNQYWLRFTRRLIDIYQQHEIFQSGSFIEIHSEKDIYVFSRFSGHNCSLVILNKSNKEKIKPITLNQLGDFRGNEFNELLSGKNYLVNENNELELTNNSNSSLLVNVL